MRANYLDTGRTQNNRYLAQYLVMAYVHRAEKKHLFESIELIGKMARSSH